jgi:hypothetical protein
MAAPVRSDVLVVFGITGDLARVMTYQALYRLEKRGLLPPAWSPRRAGPGPVTRAHARRPGVLHPLRSRSQRPDHEATRARAGASARGLICVDSVTKKKYEALIAEDAASMSGKAKKARHFGKPVLSVHEFLTWAESAPVVT